MQHQLAHSQTSLWDRIWRNHNDEIIIFQWPNIWLVGWAVATMFSLFTNGKEADIFSGVGIVLLLVWSGLEIYRGANYFRRGLGVVVLLFSIVSAIKLIT